MKVFGFWERLTKIVFFRNGQVTVQPADQGAVEKSIEIPNISPATGQSVVLTDQAQTLIGKTISGADNTFQAIPGAALNADSVTADKLDPATVGGAGLEITTIGQVDYLGVRADNISIEVASDLVQIKNEGVTTPKIADSAVTTAKIADQNVTTAKIADANVTTVKIADANVTTAKILDANVTTAKIADSAVTTEKIADNEVTNAKLETAVAVDGTGITLDKLRIEDGVGSNPDGRGKVLKRDSTTGAVVNGNQIPSTGEVLTDTVAQTALLKTLDRLQTQLVSISMTSSTVFHGNRVGVIEVLSSVTGAITEISVQNDDGAHLVIVNKTAAPILIDNEAVGASSGLQILTGTGGPINLASNGSLFLVYRTGTVNKWHVIGGTGGGAGGTVTQVTTPVAHGFTAADKGKALYLNGSVYAPAIATAANTAEIVGILAGVIDSDTFELATGGAVESISGDDFEGGSVPAKGTVIFLSASEAGKYTSTEPSVVGYISKPVGIIFESNKMFMYNMRGTVIGAANARTTIAVLNNAATDVVDVTNYNSLKLEGELNVTRSSGGNHRAYYTVEAAKNGAGVWQVSASYTGDDVLYTTLPSWDVSANQLQVTMPNVTNFSSASLTYALGAPAVGASLPLSIDSSSINIVESAPLSNRNLLINGNFDIWQRGTSQTNDGYGSDDRWNNLSNGSTKTHSQEVFALGQTEVPGNPKYFSRTVVSSVANVGSYVIKQQRIESVTTLAGQTATLSFWAKADDSKNIAVEFEQYFGSGGSPSAIVSAIGVTTIALTTSWKKYTVTVDLPALVDEQGQPKVLGTDGKDVLRVNMWFEAGSAFDNRTNSLGQQSGTFDIAQVQLEAGSKATAFEKRPYGTELALCQRYFQWNSPGSGRFNIYGTQFAGTLPVLVPMRAQPSIVFTSTILGGIDELYVNRRDITGNPYFYDVILVEGQFHGGQLLCPSSGNANGIGNYMANKFQLSAEL